MEQGIYELPLNERLRTFMRIEFLYSRLKYFNSSLEDTWKTRTVIHTVLEIYSILSRTDVRREVLADLDRYIMQMQRFQSVPEADNEMVNNVLEDLESIKSKVLNIGTEYLAELRNDDFIASLLHRHTLPGVRQSLICLNINFSLNLIQRVFLSLSTDGLTSLGLFVMELIN